MKVIVIGNGIAGNTASSTIRRLDSQADITIISEEPHPEYSACALPYYIAGELERQSLFLRTSEDYAREGIKTILGQKVTAIDPENKKVSLDAKSLTYDKLIVATGSKPIVPPVKGFDLDGVFPLKSVNDADRILHYSAKAAAVVGSGPIGVEASIALSKRGLRVYLVELLDRVMPRVFDETPAALLRGILEEQGIKVFTGEKVTTISGNGKVEGIVTDKRQIECDMVIFGVGMKSNIELAKQSGLKIGGLGGISVDRHMMTSFDDIYACGDCVEAEDMITGKPTLSLLWHNAKQQGEVAGYNCAGVSRNYLGSQNITSTDIFGIHVASFGCLAAESSQQDNIEVIEKLRGKNYHRLSVAKGKLVGAQFIGDARDMGALLSILVKGESLSAIKQAISKTPTPLHYRVAQYLASSRLSR